MNKQMPIKVQVSHPKEVTVELVQSNDVRHYEIFGWLFSLMMSIAAGFWVAYCTTEPSTSLLLSSIVFTLVSIIFLFFAGYYRYTMRRHTTSTKITQ